MEDKILKIKPYEQHLDLLFKEYWVKLEKANYISLNKLSEAEPLPKTGGIYVFYEEKEKPIYVGRTKNIRQRIQLHTRDSSKNESATFTFNLARMEYRLLFPDKKKTTRSGLMSDLEFIPLFNLQRDRVQKMYLRYISEEHDILQTILEPYFALKLKTYPNYNNFETH